MRAELKRMIDAHRAPSTSCDGVRHLRLQSEAELLQRRLSFALDLDDRVPRSRAERFRGPRRLRRRRKLAGAAAHALDALELWRD